MRNVNKPSAPQKLKGITTNMENTIAIHSYSTPWAFFPQKWALPLNSLFWSPPTTVHRFDAWEMRFLVYIFLEHYYLFGQCTATYCSTHQELNWGWGTFQATLYFKITISGRCSCFSSFTKNSVKSLQKCALKRSLQKPQLKKLFLKRRWWIGHAYFAGKKLSKLRWRKKSLVWQQKLECCKVSDTNCLY